MTTEMQIQMINEMPDDDILIGSGDEGSGGDPSGPEHGDDGDLLGRTIK